MKIVAVIGSPRKDSSSTKVTEKIIEGARDAGNEVSVYRINEMNIRGCQACGFCKENKVDCIQDDDLKQYWKDLHECVGLIVSAPNYCSQVSGPMITFMNRHYCIMGRDGPTVEPGKIKLVGVFASGGPVRPGSMADRNYDWYLRDFEARRMIRTEKIVVDGSTDLSPDGEVMQHAYEVGKSLWVNHPVRENAPVVKQFNLASPSGNTALTVNLAADGALTYSAAQDGIPAVETSPLGLKTSVGDFTSGLEFVSEEDRIIDETYPVLSGKKRIYTNRANEKTLTFKKDGACFGVILRAYDDGIAFRYAVNTADAQDMTVEPNGEITAFNLPDGAKFWYMPRDNKMFMYEGNYIPGKIGESGDGCVPSLPMLYETNGKYGLIMEADRHGNYSGSMLRLENGKTMQLIFDIVQTEPVQTATPFVSPWRTVILGSSADILKNTMVENLSPAPDPKYEFDKWVKPGVSAWSWVSYYGGQEDPEIHKRFIDLAADMGWRYYILDERWQPECKTKPGIRYEGMQPWFPEVKAHADEKGVKLIAWVNKTDVEIAEERIARFKEWSEAGIVGIKVDFFFNDSQKTLGLYDDIYRDAADYKLLVNAHGSNPPSGEIRTYPNALGREAIRGQEQGGITVEQYTLIPFLRAAVGTADVTEQLYSRDTRKTTMGFQIALSVLIENGMRSLGSKPEEYYSVPEAVDLYKNYPASWDDYAVIDAEVGKAVNVARKAGETWYAGGISVEERTFSYKPFFLDAGKTYTATIYREQAGERQAIEMETIPGVTAESIISANVQPGGGYVVRFVPAE